MPLKMIFRLLVGEQECHMLVPGQGDGGSKKDQKS